MLDYKVQRYKLYKFNELVSDREQRNLEILHYEE